ncbi:stalk domain-containing protein [Fictibacillus phosphorivorans]|uniref:stalk domain-containing protein n=1 Tax=Fictibacillus phosphorivorans TaxID=1221500 RepID=UPI00203D32C6|nr:stalk domain-containing protein [Fictibacillus phosphorivorans]MCM3718504.1 copper amine oxidase N-terminal domain-containing protein [Fictibacillus phosphorivorans]MCM3776140.1 copper amine oxidase N-terminal domain-containing protein [Fictibacillus phosphorivorans]
MKKSLAKWVTATTLTFTAVAAAGTTGFAAKKEQQQDTNIVTVVYQGHKLSLEGARLVRENLILPVEAIADANGGNVKYDKKSITATRGDISYTMKLHPRFFQFDNDGVLFAIIPAKIYSGKAINSLKQIERTLGVTLEFSEEENTLYIN